MLTIHVPQTFNQNIKIYKKDKNRGDFVVVGIRGNNKKPPECHSDGFDGDGEI